MRGSPYRAPASRAPSVGLSHTACWIVLCICVLAWFFAGMQMATTSLTMRDAALDLLSRSGAFDLATYREYGRSRAAGPAGAIGLAPLTQAQEADLEAWNVHIQSWFAWFVCAFLFGAAAGGWVFGRLGDAIGRSRALAASVLTYASIALSCWLVPNLPVLLILWFLSCMGIGGTWPNGVALVSEVWSRLSRPMVAGLMGAAANVGILTMGLVGRNLAITADDWRWVFLLSSIPLALGLLALWILPESPRWLRERADKSSEGLGSRPASSRTGVFRPPYLGIASVGIVLATVPILGGWGSANWMIPWADEAGQASQPPDPYLKATVQQYRALAGTVGSLLGGWIAAWIGRRTSYALISLAALACAQYAFWFTVPTDPAFLWWVAALGFFGGAYFGWLPLVLPELFPTRIRATGSGVSFNSGRILTAVTVFLTGLLIRAFDGDYAAIGKTTSWIFAVGAVAIWLAPDTTQHPIEDTS